MKRSGGYTILEVLIFIAVSGVMFVGAMIAIGGRQSEVQFSQSVREFEAKIRDIINDVSTGYYPTNDTVSCYLDIATDQIEITSSSNEQLGTNDDCIYIGKALQFRPDDDGSKMKIILLAGRRYEDSKLKPSTTIAAAKPKAIAKPGDANFTSTIEEYQLLYGVEVYRVVRPLSSAPVEDFGLIGVLSDFGGASISETQSPVAGGVVGSEYGMNESQAVTLLDSLTDDITKSGTNGYIEKNTTEGIVICLRDERGRKASVSFGSQGRSAVQLDIDNYNLGCNV